MKKLLLAVIGFTLLQSVSAQKLPYSAKNVKPLQIGNKIPNTTITTEKDGDITTDKLFKKKQTILVVYRGGWCPFCNRQLSGLARVKDQLVGMNYQIIAVSPDSESTSESQKYAKNYIIASDSSTKLIQRLGVAYQAPKKYTRILRKASKGKNTTIIPAPSIFILNNDGEIVFEHVSTNFRKRLSSDLLLAIAEGYKEI